jgi:DNA-binding MarR family transcriptional regulator
VPFSRAAFAAVGNGQQLASDLKALHDGWTDDLRARKDAVVWRVLPLLLRQPSMTSKLVQEAMNVTQPAADNALRQLEEVGALSKPKTVHGEGQKRNVVWQATAVLEALDRFGERARRNPRTG